MGRSPLKKVITLSSFLAIGIVVVEVKLKSKIANVTNDIGPTWSHAS